MARIQGSAGNGNEPYSFLISGVTAGSTIIVGAHIGGAAATVGTISVSDDKNAGAYEIDATQVSPAGDDQNQLQLFRKTGCAAGDTNVTVNATGTSLYVSAVWAEYGGELLLDVANQDGSASGNNVSNYTSPTVTTTGATRTIIGLIGSDTTPASGFTPNGGESEIGETNGRIQMQDEAAATAGSYSSSWALGGSTDVASIVAAYYAPSTVTVTDVDTDETITADQTNVVVTGTGFGSSQGAGTVTIRQGSTSVAQTIDSWSDTSIQFDVVFDSTTDLKYGAATLRVTENGGAYGELAITISPQTGYVYTDLLTPNTTSAYRLSASLDLAAGDQVRGRGLNGNPFPTGHTIETDATVTLDTGITGTAFEASAWDAGDSTWGSWARIDVDPNPVTVSPPVGALTLSGLAPSVALGNNQRIAVPVGSLTVTAYAPTVAVTTGVQTIVPPVTGLTRTAAQAAIEAAGLVEAPFFYFDSAAVNTVLSQSPAAGTVVEEDSTVEIRVSVGTEVSNVVQRVGRTKFRTVQNRTKFRVA